MNGIEAIAETFIQDVPHSELRKQRPNDAHDGGVNDNRQQSYCDGHGVGAVTTMARRIAVSELRVGMQVSKLDVSWLDHPFLRNRFRIDTAQDIKRIVDAGIKHAWIEGEIITPKQPSPSAATESKSEPSTPLDKQPRQDSGSSMDEEIGRARKICLSAKERVVALFDDARLGKAIDPNSTESLVDEISSSIDRNPAALISVARLKTHDDYTYLHSVAVCALMLSVAKQLGLSKEEAQFAGNAGLLHDIGKALMPLEVLNKPGKLTDAEFDIMRQHPAAGARILREGEAAEQAQDVALHHHERIDGRGYPHQLRGDDISLLARMGAVCDVYDAVTSERAYKSAWDPAVAIAQMAKWEGHFDTTVFKAFVKTVGVYPVGALVRLSSQRLGIVIEPGAASLLTPKVKVFYSAKTNTTIRIETVDLAAQGCSETILGLEDRAKWGFHKFRNLDELWLK